MRYSEPAGYPAGSEYLTCGLARYFCFCRSPKTPTFRVHAESSPRRAFTPSVDGAALYHRVAHRIVVVQSAACAERASMHETGTSATRNYNTGAAAREPNLMAFFSGRSRWRCACLGCGTIAIVVAGSMYNKNMLRKSAASGKATLPRWYRGADVPLAVIQRFAPPGGRALQAGQDYPVWLPRLWPAACRQRCRHPCHHAGQIKSIRPYASIANGPALSSRFDRSHSQNVGLEIEGRRFVFAGDRGQRQDPL